METSILITGASGFVGGSIAFEMVQRENVIAIVRSNSCANEVQHSAQKVVKLDLTNQAEVHKVLSALRPRVIIHAAALANVGRCEIDPDLADRSNVLATENIINACNSMENFKPLLIYLSTDLVFDGAFEVPKGGFLESAEVKPRSVYGKTKYRAELVVLRGYSRSVVLRMALVYGKAVGVGAGFMGWLLEGLKKGEEVKLFIDEWRTPVFVGDILKTVEFFINADQKGYLQDSSSLFHLAGSERISRYTFGLKLAEIGGFNSKLLLPVKQEKVLGVLRPKDVSLNNKKLQQVTGIVFADIDQGLRRMMMEKYIDV